MTEGRGGPRRTIWSLSTFSKSVFRRQLNIPNRSMTSGHTHSYKGANDGTLPMNENELKKPWLSSAEDDDVFSDILESRHLVVFPWLIEIILGLRPASVLVVVTHPCFREESYSSFKTQFKNEDYLQNGASFGGR